MTVFSAKSATKIRDFILAENPKTFHECSIEQHTHVEIWALSELRLNVYM